MSSDEPYSLTVVSIKNVIRCVYVNDYRLVGSKPYYSEGGEYKKLEFTFEDLQKAFPQLDIKVKS